MLALAVSGGVSLGASPGTRVFPWGILDLDQEILFFHKASMWPEKTRWLQCPCVSYGVTSPETPTLEASGLDFFHHGDLPPVGGQTEREGESVNVTLSLTF